MFYKTIKYRLLAYGRKNKLGEFYKKYATAVLSYLAKKQTKFLDDLDYEGGVLEETMAPFMLTYGKYEFYTFIFANIIGALIAKFFPFLVSDFVYDTSFFLYENPLLIILFSPLASIIMLSFIPPHQKHFIRLYAFFASIFLLCFSVFLLGFFDLSSEEFQFFFQFQPLDTEFEARSEYFRFTVAVDGLSILLVVLTNFLFSLCFWFHLTEKKVDYLKEQAIIFFLLQFSILMAFMSTDVIVFYLFFEGSLIPLFLFIGVWGSRERKVYAAYKMFFYTILSSMPTLLGLIVLCFTAESSNLICLQYTNFDPSAEKVLWLLLMLSFATKLPMVPVHLWLPEAHVEATTTGSVILAGILLKLGGYGFFRFLLSLFPAATAYFSPLVFLLSFIAIIYSSLLAFRQIDLKKIIAYSSIAHMGFVSLGFACLDLSGFQGAFFILLSHGFISSGLFFCAGLLYKRYNTKLIFYFKSLASVMPVFSLVFFLFMLGNIGLPSTSGFVGEFFVFISLTKLNFALACLVATGVVLSVSYSLWTYNRICFGALSTKYISFYQDIDENEFIILLLLLIPVFVFGVVPQYLFEYFDFFAHQAYIDFYFFRDIQ